MKRLNFLAITFLLLIFFIITACGTRTTITPTPQATIIPQVTPEIAEKPGTKPEDVLVLAEKAKKEGNLVIASGIVAKAREETSAAFKKKYGINVEWIVGRPSELEARIKSERRAGISAVDIAIPGTPSAATFKAMGITLPLEPMLFLPEVTDGSKWRDGKLPFYDKDGHILQVVLMATPFYPINTDLVRKDEFSSTLDLLDPKWKGKLVISDPSIPGNASDWFTFIVIELLGRERGLQFMKDLIKQEPVVTRDERLLTQWVAQGKYPIGVAPSPAIVIDFVKMGTPVIFADMKEPRELTPGWGVLTALQDPPNPHGQKLFINWLLSKEGSSVFAPALEYPSTRVDVPLERFLPAMIPRKDDINVYKKYDFLTLKTEMMKVAAEIFAGLAR